MGALTPPARDAAAIPLVEWRSAARAYRGASVSGDLDVVACYPGGALAAVIDGLGHGPEAAAAAQAAAAVLRRQATEPVMELMVRCHEALRRTRGAVISVASFDAASATVTWLGVGNVAGVLLRGSPTANPAREDLMPRGGVVGHRMPPLRAVNFPVYNADILVLATDGIRENFSRGLAPDRPIEEIAAGILLHHGRENDDALVLVVRCAGIPS